MPEFFIDRTSAIPNSASAFFYTGRAATATFEHCGSSTSHLMAAVEVTGADGVTFMSSCLRKAMELSASFEDPINVDVESVRCGDDLLSQYFSLGAPIKAGQSLLLLGNAVIQGLALSSAFCEFMRSLNVKLYLCWIDDVRGDTHEQNEVKSFSIALKPQKLDIFQANESTFDEFQRFFDFIWVNTCPSNCNSCLKTLLLCRITLGDNLLFTRRNRDSSRYLHVETIWNNESCDSRSSQTRSSFSSISSRRNIFEARLSLLS